MKQSRAAFSLMPLLMILLPFVAFLFLKGKGIFFLFFFLSPIWNFIKKVSSNYKIEGNQFKVSGMFQNTVIPISEIESVESKTATLMQQFFYALPANYQVINLKNGYPFMISPQHPLYYNAQHKQLFFKN